MNSTFFSRLAGRAREIDSLVCIGLDPHPSLLPQPSAAAAHQFCLDLIEQCAPYACAFKPNSAFFEALGPAGMEALEQVIAAVPESIPVILDAKRGDIASTAEAYATAVFDRLGADALTASPYLGQDSVAPLVSRPERAVFLLCKTSNPGADALQRLNIETGEALFLKVARQVQGWSQHDNIGLVVGATDPAALAEVRSVAPRLWILAPGVGAQGGELEAALAAGLRDDGLGLLITVSRGIAAAPDPGAAAAALRDQINELRQRLPGRSPQDHRLTAIAAALLEASCVRFGTFALKSGRPSNIYLDLRRLASHPQALQIVARAMADRLQGLRFDRLAAVPYAALPIGTAIALIRNWSLIYTRHAPKSYGTRSEVEGVYQPGERVVLIDDVMTTGASKLEHIAKLEAAGLDVRDILVLVDRSHGEHKELEAAGYRLHRVLDLHQLLPAWRRMGALTSEQERALEDELE